MSATGTLDGTSPQIAEAEREPIIDLRDRPGGREVILHVCTRFVRGGSEQRLRDVVAALPDYDHQVILGRDSNEALLRSQLPGVEVRRDGNLRRAVSPFHDAAALVHLVRDMRAGGYAAVVTHQSKAGVLGRLAARAAGCGPVVHSLSMADFGPGYGALESLVFRTIERGLASSTTAYVVAGADLAQRFERLGVPSDKLNVVRSAMRLPSPSGDRLDARRRAAETFSLPVGRPWILYVGSLEARKNVLDLPTMLQQTIQLSVGQRPLLVVAGVGPLRHRLESMLDQIGLSDDCTLLGYVSEPDDLFAAADAVILLSRAEGLPQVLVQAAAVGTPFVACEVDGADELLELGASGNVVEQGDVIGAARALLPYLRWPPATCEPTIDVSQWRAQKVQAEHGRIFRELLHERAVATPKVRPDPGATQPDAQGLVVAVIGPDGSGKSTLCRELAASYASTREVVPIYFGSGDGPSSALRWPLKVARRTALGRKGETARKQAVERHAPATMRAPRALWALTLGREKRSKLRRAAAARQRGAIVVCDRFPQVQVPGCIDGPLLAEWSSSSSRVKRRLSEHEAIAYQAAAAAPPDVVLRLGVDDMTLRTRRPDHDATDLQHRRTIVQELRFDAPGGVVEIDSGQPLPDVLEDARRAVDSCLGAPAADLR